MTCICGHEHDFKASPACSNINCECPQYQEAIGDNSIPPDYQKYIDSISAVKDKIAWLIDHCPELKNLQNKYFVFAYWNYCDSFTIYSALTPEVKIRLTDPETIRRAKQLLASENPAKYASDEEKFNSEKNKKEAGIQEFLFS